MLSKFHVVIYRESGFVLTLFLIFNVYVLQQTSIMLLSLRPDVLFLLLLFLLVCLILVSFGTMFINFFIVDLLMLYHLSNLANSCQLFHIEDLQTLYRSSVEFKLYFSSYTMPSSSSSFLCLSSSNLCQNLSTY